MPTLSVAGTTVAVRDRSGAVRNVPIDRKRRALSGKMRSETGKGGRYMREWEIETTWLTESEGDTLMAILVAPGYVNLAGDLIGSTVSCRIVQPPERRDGPGPDLSRIRFTAQEVS